MMHADGKHTWGPECYPNAQRPALRPATCERGSASSEPIPSALLCSADQHNQRADLCRPLQTSPPDLAPGPRLRTWCLGRE